MDKKEKRTNRRLVEEAVDMLGSARMVSLQGQPFLDKDGEKKYVKYEKLDEEQGKGKLGKGKDMD